MNTVKELHHESKKEKQTHKGTIAEAVAQVEQQLNEKYNNHKKQLSEREMEESGLQYHTGVEKHGRKYMEKAAEAGREGASQEELGRLKDKYSKAYKNKKKSMDEGEQLPAPPDEVHLPKPGSKHGPVDVYKKPKNEDMLSAKDKSFAALAEPKDKITYADKIAGAKKDKKTEGNKFSGNLMKARAQGLDKADLDGDGDMEKVSKGTSTMREGWEEMQKYLEKKKGPESKGGAGKKAGTRYGGSAQQDDDEETDGEGKPVEKKKGRPKGTGTGAKHSFKKPKD
jgi:hypothetical protein